MELCIAPRAGIWCRSLSGWDAFRTARAAGREPDARVSEPLPDLLPAREGRRAPLLVRLALEVGAQACRANDAPLDEVMTVFASAMGDIQITDYMCRTLAGPAPMLSPTRFHNSVHNAASGYWSIGAENRRASTAVAAGEHSFAAALLEAAALAACARATVLLIACDVPAPGPLTAVCANRQPFAAALLVTGARAAPGWRALRASLHHAAAPAVAPGAPWLATLAAENDSARGIALLAALAGGERFTLTLPLGAAGSLALEVD